MATVTGYTAERMKEIEDTTVVDGEIRVSNLFLIQRNGTEIDAGTVGGTQGPPGPPADVTPSTDAGNDLTIGTDAKLFYDAQAPVAGNTLVFDSLVSAKAAVPAPVDGVFAYLLSENSIIVGKGGIWCWWQKSWPYRTGNTEQIVWQGAAAPASCWSITSLQGRLYTVQLGVTISTATTGANASVGNLQPGWFMGTRIDPAINPGSGSGAGSGRVQVSSTGAILPTWMAADNSVASTGGTVFFQQSLSDLRPA